MSERRRWQGAALVAGSLAVTLPLLEGAARLTLDPSRVYRSFNTVPALNQWHNEVTFWETYRTKPGADPPAFGAYDPMLGWDHDVSGDRIRGDRPVARIRPDGVRRIVALGDSFVFGTDVAADQNFSAVLEATQPDTEVLNLGVPGYGIDQAVLKYRHVGAALDPDAVVLGVYVSDYERCSMTFTYFAKPAYRRVANRIELANQPVPHPVDELNRIGETLRGRSYLAGLVGGAWHRVRTGSAEQRAFFDAMDPVVAHVLGSLRSEIRGDRQLLIVHIPPGEAFAGLDGYRAEMGRRLLAIYRHLELTYIDLHAAFLDGASEDEVFRKLYVHRPSGSVGHLSAAGHRRVAELIGAALSGA